MSQVDQQTYKNQWKYLMVFSVMGMFCLAQTAYAGATIEYYSFLAFKHEGKSKLSSAPDLKIKELFSLPAGDYYLHMIALETDTDHWNSYSYKMTLKKEVPPRMGSIVTSVHSLTQAPASVTLLERELEELSYRGNKQIGAILPSFLRKLVLSDAESSLFKGSNYRIHRLHKLTVDQLSRQTLQNLWRIWDPKLKDYDADKTTSENMEVLEQSIENNKEEIGFAYSSTDASTSEQSELKNYFLRFVEELRVEYQSKIKPMKRAYQKHAITLRKHIDIARKAEKELENLFSIARNENADSKLINEIKRNLNHIDHTLDKAKMLAKKSTREYKIENFEQAIILAKDAIKMTQKTIHLAEITSSMRKSLNINEPNNLGKWIIGLFLIPLFVIGALFLLTPTLFSRVLSAIRLKKKSKKGNNSEDLDRKYLDGIDTLKESTLHANTIQKTNSDHNSSNSEDINFVIDKLKSENAIIKKMIGKVSTPELSRIAKDRAFIDKLFANHDAKYLIKQAIKEVLNNHKSNFDIKNVSNSNTKASNTIPAHLYNKSDDSQANSSLDTSKKKNNLIDGLSKKLGKAKQKTVSTIVKTHPPTQHSENTTQKSTASLNSNVVSQPKVFNIDSLEQLDENLSSIALSTEIGKEKEAHQLELAEAKHLTDNLSKEIEVLKQQLQEANPSLNAVQLEVVRVILEKNELFDNNRWIQWLSDVSHPEDLIKRLLSDSGNNLSSTTWHELNKWLQSNTDRQWSLDTPEPKDRYSKALHHCIGVQQGQRVPGLISFCEKPGLQQNGEVVIKAKVKITTT